MQVSARVFKALCKFISKDETKPALNCIHLKGATVEATNGHIAAIAEAVGIEDSKLVDPRLVAGQLAIEPENVTFDGTAPTDEEYPELQKVIDKNPEPVISVLLDARYLKDLCDLVIACNYPDEKALIHLDISDPHKPIIFRTTTDSENEAIGMISPVMKRGGLLSKLENTEGHQTFSWSGYGCVIDED